MSAREGESLGRAGRVWQVDALAPAKLNLGLRIVGCRADGYHLLDSVFVPLDLADGLGIRVALAERGQRGTSARIQLRVDGGPAGLEKDERNLAVRAAEAFLAEAELAAEVHITLDKKIPVGAGMGGGSSDAGAVLRTLDVVFPGVVSAPRLAALAVSLGADVPYFLDPRPARVRGIGEEIEPLAGFPSLSVVVATPEPPLATADVFRAWDRAAADRRAADPLALTPGEPGRSMPPPIAPVRDSSGEVSPTEPVSSGDSPGRDHPGSNSRLDSRLDSRSDSRLDSGLDSGRADGPPWDWQGLRARLANDLEPVARELRSGVARLRTEIERAGAEAVGMSGSGPTVFGIFGAAEAARAAAASIRWERTDRVYVGKTTGSP